MTDLSIARNFNEERLMRAAPSIFAQEPHSSRSEKYRFIPTIDVVRPLLEQGFSVRKAHESRYRDAGKAGYVKHQVVLRHGSQGEVGGLVPEVIITNSHDGSSAFNVRAGIYRPVCSNGLVVGNDALSERVMHSGRADDVIEGVYRVLDDLPQALETTREWNGIQLTGAEQTLYAQSAAQLRWDADAAGNLPINPASLIQVKRWGDNGNDLFTVFNRVQEAIIKGGVRAVGSTGKVRRAKAVDGVNENTRLNKALWNLTAGFAELKKAA